MMPQVSVFASRVFLACCLAALLAACGRDATTPSAAAQGVVITPAPTRAVSTAPAGPRITIDNFTFTPAALTVAAGTIVTWVNHDDIPHTVTAQDHAFSSSGLDTDDHFSHAFTASGTYTYYCTIHPKMTATISVR
jgi:plastocyanin